METNSWKGNIESLQACLERENIEQFIRWPVIQKTMFVGNVPYIDPEYKYLVEHERWETWKEAIKETDIGNPIRYTANPDTSANTIHGAYYLAVAEDRLKFQAKDMKYIFELGAGYGCFAKTVKNLGFNGTYYIHDLDVFMKLQKYYLDTVGVPVVLLDNLENIDVKEKDKALFVSTWAFSETPMEMREDIWNVIRGFKYILITFQDTFDRIDNYNYFREKAKELTDYSWTVEKIEHMPGHNLMIGEQFYI